MDARSGESILVTATTVGFSSSLINPNNSLPAYKAVLVVNSGSIRLRYDPTAPTSTTGILLEKGDTFEVEGLPNMSQTRMIKDSGSIDADVFITYEFGIGY